MRGTAKLATGVAARCPAAIVRRLSWLLLAAALYGEWVWARSACETFGPAAETTWQVVNGLILVLWCVANFLGAVLAICESDFRGSVRWRNMWRPGKDVLLWEPVLWAAFAPVVAAGALAEMLCRAGSFRIRRGR